MNNDNENKDFIDTGLNDNTLFGEYLTSFEKIIEKLKSDELMINALRKGFMIIVKMIAINFIIDIGIIVAMVILYLKG